MYENSGVGPGVSNSGEPLPGAALGSPSEEPPPLPAPPSPHPRPRNFHSTGDLGGQSSMGGARHRTRHLMIQTGKPTERSAESPGGPSKGSFCCV